MKPQVRRLKLIDEPPHFWPRVPISNTVFEATVGESFTGFLVRFYMPKGAPTVVAHPDAAVAVAEAVRMFKAALK